MTEASQIPFHSRRANRQEMEKAFRKRGAKPSVIEPLIVLCAQQCAVECSGARR